MGSRYNLPIKNAYQYLKHFQGIHFLIQFYNTLHLQSIEDTVDDLVVICQKNGGTLAWYSTTIRKMTKEQINKYLTNRAVDKMTEYLMQDYNISIEQALDFIYNSDTYQKLNDKETGLYVESPAYIYQLLDREYKTGVFA